MTDVQQPSTEEANDFSSAGAEKLRECGYRLTPQRVAILEFLEQKLRHQTPQMVYGVLESQVDSLSLATVYNTLELLYDLELLRKFTDEDGQTYYDPSLEPHHHGMCEECGEIFDLNVSRESVEGMISSSSVVHQHAGSFHVQDATIWFRGACADCSSSVH